MPPTAPINHRANLCNQQIGQFPVLSHAKMFRLTEPALSTPISSSNASAYTAGSPTKWPPHRMPSAHERRAFLFLCSPAQHCHSNYEFFNCNNFNIRYWSWNYRGCWHQTCPPIAFLEPIYITLIKSPDVSQAVLFLVTTSLCQDWVICAPAAIPGCGSRFSGSLSESNPYSPLPVITMVGLYPTIHS